MIYRYLLGDYTVYECPGLAPVSVSNFNKGKLSFVFLREKMCICYLGNPIFCPQECKRLILFAEPN